MAYGTVNADTVTTSTAGGVLGAGNASIMKNRLINGTMAISQYNGTSSITPTIAAYVVDRWQAIISQSSKLSFQQNAGSVTTPAGFTNYLGATSLSAYSLVTSDYFLITQKIEGNNISDLGWGTASGKSVTLSFQVYSSLTGTFGLVVGNAARTNVFPAAYSIPVANTWTPISIQIPAPPNGASFPLGNGIGIEIDFGLGVASNLCNTAGSWANGGLGVTGATSVVGTSGATFYITGVQLEVGSSATGYEYRQYGQELALCQRYYAKTYDTGTVAGTATTSGSIGSNVSATWGYAPAGTWCFPVAMRTQPTITIYSTINANTTGVVTSDLTDGSGTYLNLGLSSVFIRRNNNSSGVVGGSDVRAQATASAEL